jgi:hypothetical protein
MIATNYSFGIEREEAQLKRNDVDHTKWTNPLEVRYVFHFRARKQHLLSAAYSGKPP